MNTQRAQEAGNAISRELKRRNLPQSKLPLIMHQLAVETAGFDSLLAVSDNNYSGVKFFGQKQARQGRPVPRSEYVKGAKFGNFYAKYDSIGQWAEDYLNILQRFKALDAETIEDFATRLKNGPGGRSYFQSTLSDYIAALKSWGNTFRKRLPSLTTDGQTISLIAAIAVFVVIILIIKNS